jgi:hypothetical protein
MTETQAIPTTFQRAKWFSLSSTLPETTFGMRQIPASRTMAFHAGLCGHSPSFTLKDAHSWLGLNIPRFPSFTCPRFRLYSRYFYLSSLFSFLIQMIQRTCTPSFLSSVPLCLLFYLALYPKTRDFLPSFPFDQQFLLSIIT